MGAWGAAMPLLYGIPPYCARAARPARIAASARSASGSVHRQRTPASIVKRGWPWSWIDSTSSRTAATRSATAIGSSTIAATAWAVNATSRPSSTVSAQRGSSRRRASESRRSASASRIVRGPARSAVDTGMPCGGPPPVERIATVPGDQSGSSSTARRRPLHDLGRHLDLPLADLPRRVRRQRVDEPHVPRVLVGGDLVAHERAQLLLGRRGPVAQHDG